MKIEERVQMGMPKMYNFEAEILLLWFKEEMKQFKKEEHENPNLKNRLVLIRHNRLARVGFVRDILSQFAEDNSIRVRVTGE